MHVQASHRWLSGMSVGLISREPGFESRSVHGYCVVLALRSFNQKNKRSEWGLNPRPPRYGSGGSGDLPLDHGPNGTPAPKGADGIALHWGMIVPLETSVTCFKGCFHSQIRIILSIRVLRDILNYNSLETWFRTVYCVKQQSRRCSGHIHITELHVGRVQSKTLFENSPRNVSNEHVFRNSSKKCLQQKKEQLYFPSFEAYFTLFQGHTGPFNEKCPYFSDSQLQC